MHLLEPSLAYEKSFASALEEMRAAEGILFWVEAGNPATVAEYVALRLDHAKGKRLPEHWIPATTYWLIDNEIFIGEVNIRHELTEHLRTVGGHIGYWIRPSKRQQGYGREILKMALKKAKVLGLTKVRITCDETNAGSKKIIETNGGVFDGTTDMGAGLPRKLLYWIPL